VKILLPKRLTRNFLTRFVITSISKNRYIKEVYIPNVALELILTVSV